MNHPIEWEMTGHPYMRLLETEGWLFPAMAWYDDRAEFSGFKRGDDDLRIKVVIRGDEATERVYRTDKSRWETVKVGRRKVTRRPEETVSEQVVNWRARLGTEQP